MEQTTVTEIVGSGVPFAIIGILFAIGNYFLAKRIEGASPILWAILSLIPGVNIFFFYYVAYKVIFTILDRLPPGGGLPR